jgi:hypothetical protein
VELVAAGKMQLLGVDRQGGHGEGSRAVMGSALERFAPLAMTIAFG